jgi:FkbM family methyltransferase
MKKRILLYLAFLKNEYYKKIIKFFYLSKTDLVHEKWGTQYGGGVIPINFLDSAAICYSFGAGEDISFELELVKKIHCNIVISDPTPRAKKHFDTLQFRIKNGEKMPIDNYSQSQYYSITPEDLKLCSFFPVGIWSEDKTLKFFPPKNAGHVSHSLLNLQKTVNYIEVECKNLSTVMALSGHKKINLLKLDIVGAEYEVINSLIRDEIYPDILLIEFDEGALAPQDYCLDGNYFARIENAIKMLKSAGYLLSFVDGWNTTFIRESAIPPETINRSQSYETDK